jgi:hypothetical protein
MMEGEIGSRGYVYGKRTDNGELEAARMVDSLYSLSCLSHRRATVVCPKAHSRCVYHDNCS